MERKKRITNLLASINFKRSLLGVFSKRRLGTHEY